MKLIDITEATSFAREKFDPFPNKLKLPEYPETWGDEEWKQHFKHMEEMRDQYGIDKAIWSAGVVDFSKPFPTTIKTLRYDGGWGSASTHTFENHLPTWGEVFQVCDELIADSGDNHHVYIEGFKHDGNGHFEFYTGS